MDYEAKKVFIVNIAFTVIIGVLIYIAAKFLFVYLFPFVIALLLSFLLHKPAKYLSEKTKIKISVWRITLMISVYLLVSGTLFTAVLLTVKHYETFLNDFKNLLERINMLADKIGDKFNNGFILKSGTMGQWLDGMIKTVSVESEEILSKALPKAVTSAVSFLPIFILSSAVTVVASFYIAGDYSRLLLFLRNFIGIKSYRVLTEIKDIVVGTVCRLMGGYLIIAVITFFEIFIGLTVISVKHAFIIALITALVDLLPVFGSGTVLLPWAVVYMAFGNTSKAVGLLIIYISVTALRNFTEPKIIGEKVGINPLLMLITIFLGLRIGGLGGMILLPVSVMVIITYYKNQMELERKVNLKTI